MNDNLSEFRAGIEKVNNYIAIAFKKLKTEPIFVPLKSKIL